ncbi:MAG: 3-deoxy-8-phosphooctulonate synthase [Zavarzinella sp.]
MNLVSIGESQIGRGQDLLWILGPCVIESEDLAFQVADYLLELKHQLNIQIIFKASFDKANRSSGSSYRGPGLADGLSILDRVRHRTGLAITTDVHETQQASAVGDVVDIIQIPAFLARQTDLLLAAGQTGKVVNVKKGQFMAPREMANVASKVLETGNNRILFTERGTTFGYGNLINDMRAIPQMQDIGYPVVFDATHSVQSPASQGNRTGGDRTMVPFLARAATAAGCNGIFLETHPDPDAALSDGPNMIPLSQLTELIQTCTEIHATLLARGIV